MKRLVALLMTLALVLAFSVPAAFAAEKDSAGCQKECETKAEECKQTCADDESCKKDCAETEEECKIGCN